MISSSDILHAKVLIIDNEEVSVLLLERLLRAAGYVSITSTTDPGEVCALHRKNGYDLILLDLEMPGMDGFQVMEGLKEIDTDGYLPVLAVTAHPGHKLRALQGGAKDFISKPFDLAEVLMRVHNMLEVRLSHEAARNHGKMLEALALKELAFASTYTRTEEPWSWIDPFLPFIFIPGMSPDICISWAESTFAVAKNRAPARTFCKNHRLLLMLFSFQGRMTEFRKVDWW
jgi:adenylate cyclase